MLALQKKIQPFYKIRAEVINFFMLKSAMHEISNAHMLKKGQEIQHFSGSYKNAIFPAHKC